MSSTAELKKYLIDEDDGYLLSDDNNGKTIMLSGVWGVGKTHFWQNEIEPKVIEKLREKDKTCTYISLYGKDSLSELKKEVFIRASTENVLLSKEVSTFGFEALSSIEESGLAIGKVLNAAKGLNNHRKSSKGIKRLQDGGIICFDDFERKSKEIDLNDLFGFISQLAVDMKCKVVIILNSDVFEGEEANVFKTVKEKTVNKFFYFEPTIEELFGSIYDREDNKYKKLDNYSHDILKAIKETKELNARLYEQVLDNCLEWIKQRAYNQYELRALVLIIINFIKNHFIFDYRVLKQRNHTKLYTVLDKSYQKDGFLEIAEYFIQTVPQISLKIKKDDFEKYLNGDRDRLPNDDSSEFIHRMNSSMAKKNIEKKTDKRSSKETINENTTSESFYEKLNNIFHENKNIFYALYYYAYVLDVEYGVDKEKFDEINQFVKTGILLPKNKQVLL